MEMAKIIIVSAQKTGNLEVMVQIIMAINRNLKMDLYY